MKVLQLEDAVNCVPAVMKSFEPAEYFGAKKK